MSLCCQDVVTVIEAHGSLQLPSEPYLLSPSALGACDPPACCTCRGGWVGVTPLLLEGAGSDGGGHQPSVCLERTQFLRAEGKSGAVGGLLY